jgi:hypothetical protein
MDHVETGLKDVDWIHLAQDRPTTGSCEHGNEHSSSMKGGEFLDKLAITLASQQGLCSMKLLLLYWHSQHHYHHY